MTSVGAVASADDQFFTISGSAKCLGADLYEISSLTLTRRPTGEVVGEAPPVSCTACMSAISTSATVPAPSPGQYRLTMRIHAEGNGKTFNVSRAVQYDWLLGNLSLCNRTLGQSVSHCLP